MLHDHRPIDHDDRLRTGSRYALFGVAGISALFVIAEH